MSALPLLESFFLTPVAPRVWELIPAPVLTLANWAVWSLVTWVSLSVNGALE